MSQESPIDQLRLQYAELAEIAGSLAHEIKTPLSVIRMNIEFLAEDFAKSSNPEIRRAAERVETVRKHCLRLENLLNDFLRFTRLNKLELLSGSLNQLIGQVLDLCEADAIDRNIEIVRYLDPDLPSIKMDKQTLHAALLNLVKNALESMPDGGELMVRSRLSLYGVALDLVDSGTGMDDTTLFNMFQAFYTTKDGGSGLGLPTAKKIIEAHGGLINVQSEIGRGTQFTLEFPTPRRI